MDRTDMSLSALDGELMCLSDRFLGASGEIVKVWHGKYSRLEDKSQKNRKTRSITARQSIDFISILQQKRPKDKSDKLYKLHKTQTTQKPKRYGR